MENRPKIKLTLSRFDNALELTSKIFLALIWALTLYAFLNLPNTIPIHFNAKGHADNFGNKTTLIILPALATIIYLRLTQLNKYPHIFNYLKKITTDNAHQQYLVATRVLRFIKVTVLIIFSWIILFTYLTTIGIVHGLGLWFLPIAIVLLLIPTIFSIIQSLKKVV